MRKKSYKVLIQTVGVSIIGMNSIKQDCYDYVFASSKNIC